MDAESLERPALVVDGVGRWRLYLSCATTGTRHWRVELLEAASPDAFVTAGRRVVMPGDEHVAMKDPVILSDERGWRAWICCHPLDDPDATDRMWTEFATSDDGIDWTLHGPALQPTPGRWDQRGTRVTAIIERGDDRRRVLRRPRESLRRTGRSAPASRLGRPDHLEVVGDAPVAQAPAPTRRCATRASSTTAIAPPCTTRPAATTAATSCAGSGSRVSGQPPVAVTDNEPVAFDEDLAGRIRELIGGEKALSEKRMFGGLAFLIGGNMAISASGQGGLLVRVDPAKSDALAGGPHVEVAIMRGREMPGWLRVDAEGVKTKAQLQRWVDEGVAYARSLPGKPSGAR